MATQNVFFSISADIFYRVKTHVIGSWLCRVQNHDSWLRRVALFNIPCYVVPDCHSKYFLDEFQPNPPQLELESIRNPTYKILY
jgi:hypothetical protein